VELEAKYKGLLGDQFKLDWPWVVWQRHEDHFAYGIPDISVTGGGATTWLEAKVLNPRLKSKRIQEVQLLKLGTQGRAWYIIWDLRVKTQPLTRIVHPKQVVNRLFLDTTEHDERTYTGIDHRSVVEFIRSTHTR
jgi:hypothetical protein